MSARFHERWDGIPGPYADDRYRQSLLYLLLAETSCYRYWGHGYFTDVAREICGRGIAALEALVC